MVFGKKRQTQQPQESISMNEDYSEDYNSDLINQSFGSPTQPLQVAQPFVQQNQPMQMPPQMQQAQPVQQMQIQRPQINLPPIQQTMQMQPIIQPMQVQQVQQVQQPVSQAMIIGVEMSTEGEFIYKVVTNYLLNLGHCQLVN